NYDLLAGERKALGDRPFEPDAHLAWRQKLRQFRGLLANHRLAWQWTMYPPCGVNGPAPCSCAGSAMPTEIPGIAARGFGLAAHEWCRLQTKLRRHIDIAAPRRTREGTCTVT